MLATDGDARTESCPQPACRRGRWDCRKSPPPRGRFLSLSDGPTSCPEWDRRQLPLRDLEEGHERLGGRFRDVQQTRALPSGSRHFDTSSAIASCPGNANKISCSWRGGRLQLRQLFTKRFGWCHVIFWSGSWPDREYSSNIFARFLMMICNSKRLFCHVLTNVDLCGLQSENFAA
jgi:hypothetical protein